MIWINADGGAAMGRLPFAYTCCITA